MQKTNTKYSSLLLKSGRDHSVLNRHPWIFSGAVKQLPPAEEGSIVAVCDNHHQLLGYGFFSPKSQITCRMFEWTQDKNMIFDENYWVQKIANAFALRRSHVITNATNAYRLLHAEGDNLPGIIVDVYNKVAVVQILIKGTALLLPHLIKGIQACGIDFVYLKSKFNTTWLEGFEVPSGWWNDTKPTQLPIVVKENSLLFEVDVENGQKTGFFLDQRDNRALLQHYSKGKKVLNTFSYTGGFSVYAAAAGAMQVVSVDISKDAVAQAMRNVVINGYENLHQGITADCFDYLKENQDEFEVIVLDPPAFAKSAKAVANASRGYKEINLAAFKRIAANGILFTFSCSQNIDKKLFRQIVFAAAADSGRNVRILHQMTQPIDHPINMYHPEGEYLKGLVLYVE
jgi:23S rRNA (cytosine1962-C5)-methyltransferase